MTRAVTRKTSRTPVFPRIARRRSKLHGWGVFAVDAINKNKRIIDYDGQLITNKQSEWREDRYLSKGCIWVFRVNRNWSRDAAVGGYADEIAGTDPSAAIAWAETMGDAAKREKALQRTFDRWKRTDETAANAWLAATPALTPEARQRLQAK